MADSLIISIVIGVFSILISVGAWVYAYFTYKQTNDNNAKVFKAIKYDQSVLHALFRYIHFEEEKEWGGFKSTMTFQLWYRDYWWPIQKLHIETAVSDIFDLGETWKCGICKKQITSSEIETANIAYDAKDKNKTKYAFIRCKKCYKKQEEESK